MKLFPSTARSETGSISVYHEDPAGWLKIRQALNDLITARNQRGRDIVVVCIGTDRSTGDCLGPLVGTRLKTLGTRKAAVVGTLDHPVHAVNMEERLQEIMDRHHNPFIIAVDACLGRTERVGYINVNHGAIKPGTALGKSLPPVGDIHLSGIVNVGGFLEHLVLQNTRLSLVYEMADVIARGISYSC
ncbi:MAG: spore protease YyaC [Solirubrobacterales bacterium]